jgi:transposase
MIDSYTLNHFGLVSATCKELMMQEIIDSVIPSDPQQKVSTGHAIVAMILNGLGFSNRRLYLFPQFFENKPVRFLVGEHLSSEDLNDDAIGRALDKSYEYGCTELFCHIASKAVNTFSVDSKFSHLDTTTFSVYGDYKSSKLEGAPIRITQGHSKQKRPDLKQILLNLLVTSDGSIPLFMQALDGNSSDFTTFRKTVTDFKKGLKKNLQPINYLVADSCFYAEETLKAVKQDLLWISRVPERINEAKNIIRETAKNQYQMTPLTITGYSYKQYYSTYAGIEQRWLIIHSEQAKARARRIVEQSVKKECQNIQKALKQIQKKEYSCEQDAWKALKKIRLKPKYHTIKTDKIITQQKYSKRGRPSNNNDNNVMINYYASCSYEKNDESIMLEIKKRSIFILATNETSGDKLTDQEIFEHYKGQNKIERGFRFLKDPLFFASSLFLKKPSRIVALTMVMCLSLMIYNLTERKLRILLKEHADTIKNQVRKPTQKPTLRWIFELFEDVHLLRIKTGKKEHWETKNIRPEGEKALRILGQNYMKPYLLE